MLAADFDIDKFQRYMTEWDYRDLLKVISVKHKSIEFIQPKEDFRDKYK